MKKKNGLFLVMIGAMIGALTMSCPVYAEIVENITEDVEEEPEFVFEDLGMGLNVPDFFEAACSQTEANDVAIAAMMGSDFQEKMVEANVEFYGVGTDESSGESKECPVAIRILQEFAEDEGVMGMTDEVEDLVFDELQNRVENTGGQELEMGTYFSEQSHLKYVTANYYESEGDTVTDYIVYVTVFNRRIIMVDMHEENEITSEPEEAFKELIDNFIMY